MMGDQAEQYYLHERRWDWLNEMQWSVCETCSAIVWDSDEHDEWHARHP